MPESKNRANQSTALIIDPRTEKQLGQIILKGKPVPVTEWMSASGFLQSFVLVEGMRNLKEVWVHQDEVLLCASEGRRLIKIITYPADGENQGYLDFTSELEPYPETPSKFKIRLSPQRGLAFLQSLLGT